MRASAVSERTWQQVLVVVILSVAIFAFMNIVTPAPASASHHDCNDTEVKVYCDLTLYWNDAENELRIRGVMAGWPRGYLYMTNTVWENGNVIWNGYVL
jgi:hypothetical protein